MKLINLMKNPDNAYKIIMQYHFSKLMAKIKKSDNIKY